MKGVAGSNFLDEVLFVREGNLCVKVAYEAFPKVFIVYVVGVRVVNVDGVAIRGIGGSLYAEIGKVVGHIVVMDANV